MIMHNGHQKFVKFKMCWLTDFSEDVFEDRIELEDGGKALRGQAAAADGLLGLEHQADGYQLLAGNEPQPEVRIKTLPLKTFMPLPLYSFSGFNFVRQSASQSVSPNNLLWLKTFDQKITFKAREG